MPYVVFKNLLRPFLLNWLTLVPTAILVVVCSKFVAGNVWWILIGVIPSAVLMILYFLMCGDVAKKDEEYYLHKKRKHIGAAKFRAYLMTPLLISVILLLVILALILLVTVPSLTETAVQRYPYRGDASDEKIRAEMIAGIGLMLSMLGCFFTTQLAFYIGINVSYNRYVKCPQCKNIFSVETYRYGDSHISEHTQYKTRTERKQVGSVKGGGEEIGVYADVQTTTAKTTVRWSQTRYCRCAVCGKELTRTDVEYSTRS